MDFHRVSDWEEMLKEYEQLWDRSVRVVPAVHVDERELEELAA
jgi:hypothetical protein